MIQVRNVPDEMHRELTRRAAVAGRTLTDYIYEVLERELAHPSPEEVFARIRAREPVTLSRKGIAELISEGRTRNDASLER